MNQRNKPDNFLKIIERQESKKHNIFKEASFFFKATKIVRASWEIS